VKKALKTLLDTLDQIAHDHEEVCDTDVREQMRDAIEKGLLAPVAGYTLPDKFGLFEPEGNARVKAALARFLEAATTEAAAAGLTTRQDRLRAFQDDAVESREGSYYDDYFGYEPGGV